MPFTSRLVVEDTGTDDHGRQVFRLVRQLHFHTRVFAVSVPSGFETDFASIPRFFWRLEPPVGRSCRAAVVHDYLYRSGLASRWMADAVWREGMRELGVHPVKRWVMWAAVRLFGRANYRKMAEAD